MKASLLLPAALAVLISASSSAQTTVGASADEVHFPASNDLIPAHRVKQVPVHLPARVPIYSVSSASPAQYRIVDSLVNAFSFYSSGNQPFDYDPLLNILAMIKRGNATQSGNNIYIRSSTDLGQTWSAGIGPLHDPSATAPARYPSLIVNALQSKTDLVYAFSAPVLSGSGGVFGGMIDGAVLGDGSSLVPAALNNGIGGATWGSDAKSAVARDSTVVTMGELSDDAIGVRTMNLNTGAQTAFVPPQWAADKYPALPASGRYSVDVGIGKDEQGMLYAAIFSHFLASDSIAGVNSPLPAISTSNDNGKTWSNLNIIPKSVLANYATSQESGVNTDSVFFPYWVQDFVVTGTGKASWALTLLETDRSKPSTAQTLAQVVEAYYDNGTWSIRKVADINGSYFLLINGTAVGDTANQVRNEVQISRTADKSKLLVKWVDILSYVFNQDIDGDGNAPDTLATSDVFTSVRDAAGTTWSPAKNVTQSPVLDREAWIPKTLPNDLSQMPLLTVQSILDPAQDVTPKQQLFDAQRLLVDRSQYVTMSNVDATALSLSVGTPGTTASDLALAIFPNPASSRVTLQYALPANGQVSVKVYNALGEEVMRTVSAEQSQEGSYTRTLDLGLLQTGAYRVVLTQNDQSVSQPLNIVR